MLFLLCQHAVRAEQKEGGAWRQARALLHGVEWKRIFLPIIFSSSCFGSLMTKYL